jgi:hypothetical protein
VKTTVVNVRREPCDVSIMRPGPWGNPHHVGLCRRCGRTHTRAEAIALYRAETHAELASGQLRREELEVLRGKRLGCVCAPLACHGDVLVDLLGEAMT